MRKILKKDSLETLIDNGRSHHQSQTKKIVFRPKVSWQHFFETIVADI